jgi:hypothetical protein
MGKIGNEAKLILKLAEERMKPQRLIVGEVTEGPEDRDGRVYSMGYSAGVIDYAAELASVVSELERS